MQVRLDKEIVRHAESPSSGASNLIKYYSNTMAKVNEVIKHLKDDGSDARSIHRQANIARLEKIEAFMKQLLSGKLLQDPRVPQARVRPLTGAPLIILPWVLALTTLCSRASTPWPKLNALSSCEKWVPSTLRPSPSVLVCSSSAIAAASRLCPWCVALPPRCSPSPLTTRFSGLVRCSPSLFISN